MYLSENIVLSLVLIIFRLLLVLKCMKFRRKTLFQQTSEQKILINFTLLILSYWKKDFKREKNYLKCSIKEKIIFTDIAINFAHSICRNLFWSIEPNKTRQQKNLNKLARKHYKFFLASTYIHRLNGLANLHLLNSYS